MPDSYIAHSDVETCNASTAHDVEGAKKKLDALELAQFPGEDVSSLMTMTLHLVKIMKLDFALRVKTGSTILKLVENTSSPYFNRIVHNLLIDNGSALFYRCASCPVSIIVIAFGSDNMPRETLSFRGD